MTNKFTFRSVEYEIRDHVNNRGEVTNFKHVFRCDGKKIKNQTELLREFLISMGYSSAHVHNEVGNLKLAGEVYNVINGKPINIPKADDNTNAL